jgi:hypothetical protein
MGMDSIPLSLSAWHHPQHLRAFVPGTNCLPPVRQCMDLAFPQLDVPQKTRKDSSSSFVVVLVGMEFFFTEIVLQRVLDITPTKKPLLAS